jgi:hypothetical protein
VTDESTEPFAGTGIDPTVQDTARIWNYWLGGKDNYAVDREAGDYLAISDGTSNEERRASQLLITAVRSDGSWKVEDISVL